MSDDCSHGQHHYHHHHHHLGLAEGIPQSYIVKLQWVVGLAILYLVMQTIGSYLSGSLALLADAGHKLADIAAISLALFASWFSSLASSPRKTFGYYRMEILAALINATGLVFIAVVILWQAYERAMRHSSVEIEGGMMLAASLVGLLINCISAKILYPEREANLNVKGALFHVLTDILNSLGEIVTAAGILLFRFYWLDTAISAIIATLVLYNASRVFGEAVNILMESAPKRLHMAKVRDFILRYPNVDDLHDLHIWTITTGKDALLAHVKVKDGAFTHEMARSLEKELRDAFNLCHITIQLEPPGFEESDIPF